MRNSLLIAGIVSLTTAAAASAGDLTALSVDDVTAQADWSVMSVTANELVYGRSGRRGSQLIWTADGMQVLGGAIRVDLTGQNWVALSGTVGFGGNNHMVDYDWFRQFVSGWGDDDWSDRSIHPDTRLDHYLRFDLSAGHDVTLSDIDTLSLSAGFRYTDIKWSAYGGRYVYSYFGFRDTRGRFPAGERGISYRQAWPVPHLGLTFQRQTGDWNLEAGLDGGVSVGAHDIDDHWARRMRFIDRYDPMPVVSARLKASYQLRESMTLDVGASFEQTFRHLGDVEVINRSNGLSRHIRNGAGADYRAMAITIGLTGKF